MKNMYLAIVLFVCAQQHAQAQLPGSKLIDGNGVLNQVNDVTRRADATAEQIRRKAERDIGNIKPGVEKLTATTEKLIDPLLKLPQQLPILNTSGKTAFVEVGVEHGWRAVEREWLVMLDDNELANLQKLPVETLEKTHFNELGLTLVRLRVPAELDSIDALKKQLPGHMSMQLDRNHIYTPQSLDAPVAATKSSAPVCTSDIKIGLIDTAVKLDHVAFDYSRAKIITKNFLEENLAEPNAHGTAVMGLLVGRGEALQPLLPNASLYSASVFYERNEYTQGATMMNLVRGLDWLMKENVSVINMSLAGPDNQILATVIARVIGSGKTIVAAAGNDGPATPPMFPAAYPGVIAVTAVDREQHIYRWANRGRHIYFSALGVSVFTARSDGGFGHESGTSMSAPVVTAFIGCELAQPKTRDEALKNLAERAIDLGEKGRDDIFGYGLLQ